MDYGFTDIATLLGALGLFLYGMRLMSDALLKLAGDRMRTILATTTANRFFAVFTGFAITAIIQSSSATTLMVVSFANAGLLTLAEAVGVIMGANIGTTVTAWLISLLGFKVSMSSLALPLVGLGFGLTLARGKTYQRWGYFLIGFAILFIGLQFLKDAMPDIRQNPQILAFLSAYTGQGVMSILLFLLIGTALTLLVQSSSATMALTLVMCHEGWIPFDLAAAMVLGENIGTTITANLAALVANHHARRAARAHLIFNLIGVAWVLILFVPFLQGIDWLTRQVEGHSPLTTIAAIPVALALFHTIFNLLNTSLLLGFVPVIARIVENITPERKVAAPALDQPRFLTEIALEYPQTALKALLDESSHLLEDTAYQAITHGLHVHRADLESGRKLREITHESTMIPLDFDRFYHHKIKPIYNEILAFSTRMQTQGSLEPEQARAVRSVLIANRLLVGVVKKLHPLHANIERYQAADNPAIRHEYNLLRRRILKIARLIHEASTAEAYTPILARMARQWEKAERLDVLLSGRIDRLIREEAIPFEMGTSLMNDSAIALEIVRDLVEIASLLYTREEHGLEPAPSLPISLAPGTGYTTPPTHP